MEKLLKVEQVAEMLGVKVNTIYNWTMKSKSKIPCVKAGGCLRFRRTDIEKWLSEPKTLTKVPQRREKRPVKSKDRRIDKIVEQAKREAGILIV